MSTAIAQPPRDLKEPILWLRSHVIAGSKMAAHIHDAIRLECRPLRADRQWLVNEAMAAGKMGDEVRMGYANRLLGYLMRRM